MVVGVNDVMRQARMIGILLPQRLENLRRLQLRRVGLVGGQRRLVHGQRVENARFDVFGVIALHGLHGFRVGERPIAMRHRGGVLEQLADRADVGALARRRRSCGEAFLHRVASTFEQRSGLDAAERIAPLGHRDAPVRDRAIRIHAEHLVEPFCRGAVFEGMQQRHGAIEVRSRFRLARGLEIDGAELLGAGPMLFVLRQREHRTDEDDGQD